MLCGFTAEIAHGRASETAKDAGYDPLRLRPIADVKSGIENLLRLATDVPIEWRLAEYMAANTIDLLSVRALSSANIGEALDVLHQNQGAQTNVRTISHRPRSGGELVAVHHGEGADNHVARFIFQSIVAAKLVVIFERFSGSSRQHQIDKRATSLGSLMQRFDRELDFIDVDYRDGEISYGMTRDVLIHKLNERDDRLAKSLDHELRRKTADAPVTGGWKDRIKYYIRSKHLGDASLDEICDTFRVQRRTLGRLLRDEGTTFTSILTELRRERALHLVRNTGLPLKRVAAELGFNSDASFNMAFKSWTGTTPMKFRKAESARSAANDTGSESGAFDPKPWPSERPAHHPQAVGTAFATRPLLATFRRRP